MWDSKVEDYFAWLKGRDQNEEGKYDQVNLDRWSLADGGRDEKPTPAMHDTCAWNPEYGLKNVLVLKPLMMRDWCRGGDAIDYAEENLHGKDWPRVDVLDYPLYPFESYMDVRTGERIKSDDVWMWNRVIRSDKEVGDLALDLLAKKSGFQNALQAKACIVPLVPHEVRELAEYLGIFAAPHVWKQLRPVLYVYGA